MDLGADFRLPAGVYERWYGQPHTAPDLLDGFALGLPELFADVVERGQHIAAPGCYPTAAAALAPLVAGGLVESTGLVVDAMSGVSGRGRGLSAASLYSEANENVAAYTPSRIATRGGRWEWALSAASGTEVQLLFTPHLVPMTRDCWRLVTLARP